MPTSARAAQAWVDKAVPDAPPAERARVASEILANFEAAMRGDLPPTQGPPAEGLPRASVRYTVRGGTTELCWAACYVPIAWGALWATRRLRLRRSHMRKAAWLRAAEELGLVGGASAGPGDRGASLEGGRLSQPRSGART